MKSRKYKIHSWIPCFNKTTTKSLVDVYNYWSPLIILCLLQSITYIQIVNNSKVWNTPTIIIQRINKSPTIR